MLAKVRPLVEEQREIDFPCNNVVETGKFVLVEEKRNGITFMAHTYNEYGDILKSEYSISGKLYMRYIYDENNRLIREEDTSGIQRKLTYDNHGNLIKDERKPSTTIEFKYSENDIKLEERCYLGSNLVVRTKFDEYGNVLKMREYHYSDTSTGNSAILINSKWQNFIYDSKGRLSEATYSDGRELIYTYDINDNVLKVYDKNSLYTIEYIYDSKGLLISTVNSNTDGSLKIITCYTYDGFGRKITEVNDVGRSVIMEYHQNSNIVRMQTIRCPNYLKRYVFDLHGNMIMYMSDRYLNEYIYKSIEELGHVNL